MVFASPNIKVLPASLLLSPFLGKWREKGWFPENSNFIASLKTGSFLLSLQVEGNQICISAPVADLVLPTFPPPHTHAKSKGSNWKAFKGLSQVRQRKTNTIWFYVYVDLKKKKTNKKTKQKPTPRKRERTKGWLQEGSAWENGWKR